VAKPLTVYVSWQVTLMSSSPASTCQIKTHVPYQHNHSHDRIILVPQMEIRMTPAPYDYNGPFTFLLNHLCMPRVIRLDYHS
jgi:hypothetical protein